MSIQFENKKVNSKKPLTFVLTSFRQTFYSSISCYFFGQLLWKLGLLFCSNIPSHWSLPTWNFLTPILWCKCFFVFFQSVSKKFVNWQNHDFVRSNLDLFNTSLPLLNQRLHYLGPIRTKNPSVHLRYSYFKHSERLKNKHSIRLHRMGEA